LEEIGGLEMSEYKTSRKEKKRKRKIELEEIYRLLELIYRELGERKYRSRLSKLGPGYRGRASKFNPRSSPKRRGRLSYAKPEMRHKPRPEKSSYGGGKPWSEVPIYKTRERFVYDSEVKGLLQKIEKYLKKVLPKGEKPKQDIELEDRDKLDVEELTKVLKESKDSEVLKKLFKKELVEINKPEPKLCELENFEKKGEEPKPETEIPADSEGRKLSKEELAELEKYLEKVGEEQGMSIVGPFEMEEAEFNRIVEKLKGGSEGEVSEQDVEPLPAEEQQPASELLSEKVEVEANKPKVQPEAVESAEIEVKPEVEPALEPIESELFDVKADILPEDLDDPVFWQKLENEIIERDFKKLEVRPEPEPLDEYGY
jgi:hypothetical protein